MYKDISTHDPIHDAMKEMCRQIEKEIIRSLAIAPWMLQDGTSYHASDAIRYATFGIDRDIVDPGPPPPTAWAECATKIYVDYSTQEKSCNHTWQTYNGLIDSFDFCTQCDQKRRQ